MHLALMLMTLVQPPQAPPLIPEQAPPIEARAPLFYHGGARVAVAEHKPLVVFVGCNLRDVPGYVSAAAYELEGYPSSCIVVADPDGDWLKWRTTLPVNATDAQIRGERQVVPAAIPFAQAPEVVDDSEHVRVPDRWVFARRGRWR